MSSHQENTMQVLCWYIQWTSVCVCVCVCVVYYIYYLAKNILFEAKNKYSSRLFFFNFPPTFFS